MQRQLRQYKLFRINSKLGHCFVLIVFTLLVNELTMKEITFSRTITSNYYIMPFIKGFYNDLFTITLKSLNDHLKTKTTSLVVYTCHY